MTSSTRIPISCALEIYLNRMTNIMEKSKNFRIDALLAHDVEQRTDSDGASPVLYYSKSSGKGPNRGCEAPSPHVNPTRASPVQLGISTKPQLLNLSQSGFTSLHQDCVIGMQPGSVYPLAALGGQHPAFMDPGFTHLIQPFQERMKGAALTGTLPLEPWVRAGMIIPRLGEYGGEEHPPCHGVIHFKITLLYYSIFSSSIFLLNKNCKSCIFLI